MHRIVAPVPRLHVLTSDAVVASPSFFKTACEVLHAIGPLGALHLRTRLLAGKAYATLAKQLFLVSKSAGALLVINDRIDVALAANVDAVQLGSQSIQESDLVTVAPQLGFGVSIHTAEEARTVAHADWMIAGHVYETKSHPDSKGRGIDFIRTVVHLTEIPVIAVGGIRPEHVAPILRLGGFGVAVIAGIWNERTPKDAALRYLSYYGDGTG